MTRASAAASNAAASSASQRDVDLETPWPRSTTAIQPIASASSSDASSQPQWNVARYATALPHHEIDAAVLRLAFVGIVAGDRLRAAVTCRHEAIGGQPCFDQIIRDRLGAFLGQRLIEGRIAIAVG